MISITCSNCKAVLTIDDAFAGGVCRCQHCGTIQTVAAAPKPSAAAAAAPASKVLHQTRRTAGGSGAAAGLDELAEVVASSGLARSGLGATRSGSAAAAPAQRNSRMTVFLLAGTALVLLALVVMLFLLLHGTGQPAAATSGQTHPAGAGEDVVTGPAFCGTSVDADAVIFLLDRGNSIAEQFDTLKANTYKALDQLGPDRKFQVIMWDNETGPAEFPARAMRSATAGEIDKCRADFQDLTAAGETHLAGALKEALDRHPSLIVVATAKPALDDDDVGTLHNAAGAGVRINAVQVAPEVQPPIPALEDAAKQSGGQFRKITANQLRAYSQ